MGSHSIDRIDGLATAPAVIRNPPDDTNETDRMTDSDFIRSVVGRAHGPIDPTDTDKAGVDRRSRREMDR